MYQMNYLDYQMNYYEVLINWNKDYGALKPTTTYFVNEHSTI